MPAKSVTTFLIEGVSVVNGDTAHIRSADAFRLHGVQSGKSLAVTGDNTAVLRTTDVNRSEQMWRLKKIGYGVTNRERYEVVNAGNGRRLAVRGGATVLEDKTGRDDAAEWIVSTTGDGSYTFVNADAKTVLEVPGRATADGTRVSTWQPNSDTNQLWKVLDETVVTPVTVAVSTVPGTAPKLPETVTATLRSGVTREFRVTWAQMPGSWGSLGHFDVRGFFTDVLGERIAVTANVTVDTFVATLPARAKAYVGGQPELPTTVTGVGGKGARAEFPVTWNPAPAHAFGKVGVVTLAGQAQVLDGSKLPATVRVQVSEPDERARLAQDIDIFKYMTSLWTR